MSHMRVSNETSHVRICVLGCTGGAWGRGEGPSLDVPRF